MDDPSKNPQPAVAISFDCTPLRGVARFEIPPEASPGFRARLERMRRAAQRHGTRNAYYLTDGSCRFQFTNDPTVGWVQFAFEGTVLTDDTDTRTTGCDVEALVERETCDWLTEPAVNWLRLAVEHALVTEFDRYISAGDLARVMQRLAEEQAASDAAGGFLGMNL